VTFRFAGFEAVTQDPRLAGAHLAHTGQPRGHPQPIREQVDLRDVRQAGLLDKRQPRVPRLGMVRILESRVAPLAADGAEHFLRGQLDRDPAEPADASVVVESQFAGLEMLGDVAEQADDHRLGQERQQAVGDQHGRPVGRNCVRPMIIGHRRRHRMGALSRRERHCQLEQSEGDFRRFASAIHQVACDV